MSEVLQMRKLVALAAAMLLLSPLPSVNAQTKASASWPSEKPIKVIVGYPPGGGIDFTARTLQAPLT